MAQRRYRPRRGVGAALHRLGLAGSRWAGVGLVALACVAAGVGVVVQRGSAGFELVRSAKVEGAQASGQVSGDAEADSGGAQGPAGEAQVQELQTYRVHVDGAVAAPGVVELAGADLRVADAVDACGGLTAEADTTSVNLAEPLMDGSKIHIPTADEQEAAQPVEAPTGQAMTVGATGTGEGQVLININTATAAELQQLRGIGEVTAQAIVDDRTRNGPFASPEDLMRVSGIGEKRFENVRGSICV